MDSNSNDANKPQPSAHEQQQPDSAELQANVTELVPAERQINEELVLAIFNPIEQWATVVTDHAMDNSEQVIRSKMRSVLDFFLFADKPPHLARAADVIEWYQQLRRDGYADSTVYAWVSRVSSFYEWLLKDPARSRHIEFNPVRVARPKAPIPYANARPIEDTQLMDMIQVIQDRAEAGDIVGRRDYALLMFYLLTGMSRAEILRLRWKNIIIKDDELVFYVRVFGGKQRARSIKDTNLREALLDYLAASGRLDSMQPEDPLWIRHDRAAVAAEEEKPLTVQAVDKTMRRYATQAGIDGFHLHRFRHSYARMVQDKLQNVEEVREAMGHETIRATNQLLTQINIERDLVSEYLARRLGISKER